MALIAIIISISSLVGCLIVGYFSYKWNKVALKTISSIKESTTIPKGFGTTVNVHENILTQHDVDIKDLVKRVFKIEFVLKSRSRDVEKPKRIDVTTPGVDEWVRENL